MFVARKEFVHDGKYYYPGDPVEDFPQAWPRPEATLRTGLITEVDDPKPKRRSKPQVEVETGD